MNKETYRSLLANIVKPVGDELCNGSNIVRWTAEWESRLFGRYEHHRNETHKRMRHARVGIDGRIDRHKVGAAFIMAVIESKPLVSATGIGANEKRALFEYIPNEILAFKTGLQTVVSFTKSCDIAKSSDIDLPFQYPPASDSDYLEHTYKALFHAGESHSLDLLTLANLLFVLEAYNNLVKRNSVT